MNQIYGFQKSLISNLIDFIQGDDLVEFHRAAVLGLQLCGDDSSTTSLPRELLGVSPNMMATQTAAYFPNQQQQNPSQVVPNEPPDQGQLITILYFYKNNSA